MPRVRLYLGGRNSRAALGKPIPFAETSSVSDREHRLHRVKRYPLCTAGILPQSRAGRPRDSRRDGGVTFEHFAPETQPHPLPRRYSRATVPKRTQCIPAGGALWPDPQGYNDTHSAAVGLAGGRDSHSAVLAFRHLRQRFLGQAPNKPLSCFSFMKQNMTEARLTRPS